MKIVVETKRLFLREYTIEDFAQLYEILSDPETMKFYPKPRDENDVAHWLDWSINNYKKKGFGLWAIELKETGKFIGDCGITMQNIDGEILPEIGYHIHKNYWRQGYGKESATAVLDWFFENTDFEAAYSYMNILNVPSFSTAKAMGMKKIKEYHDSEMRLCCVYQITRNTWQALKFNDGNRIFS